MSLDLSHIPLPMLEYAKDEGLHDETVAEAWAAFVDWHVKTFGQSDFRMRDWHRQVVYAKRDLEELVPTTSEALSASRREYARRRKALEDEAYDRAAVSFEAYCATLGPLPAPRRCTRGCCVVQDPSGSMTFSEWLLSLGWGI